ncbi:MAG: hypothetical protein JNK61_12185 [Bacteroidia bacterium]|nr:hypothetical protein [Bacteroidia bacterium]HQV00437.1 hypothetical protein [Bacteroidia bacterium]
MFGSVVLDVTIGLVFIYLLYSLLATILNEIITTNIGMRARFLRKGIERMLNDEYVEKYENALSVLDKVRMFYRNTKRSIRGFFLLETGNYKKSFAAKFYDHPAIYYMAENKLHSKPSYMDAQNFSDVLLAILSKNQGNPANDMLIIRKALQANEFELNGKTIHLDKETREELMSKLVMADFDFVKFKASLETWFDQTMERTSGWYKRKVQLILFFVGFFIAAAFNVNTFKIVDVLSKDKDARSQLVALAMSTSKSDSLNQIITISKDTTTLTSDSILRQTYETLLSDQADIANILGSGWGFDKMRKKVKDADGNVSLKRFNTWDKIKYIAWRSFNPINNLWGFLVTAMAISLGAPFWFDLLNKLKAIKGSGQIPANDVKTTEATLTVNPSKIKSVQPFDADTDETDADSDTEPVTPTDKK